MKSTLPTLPAFVLAHREYPEYLGRRGAPPLWATVFFSSLLKKKSQGQKKV